MKKTSKHFRHRIYRKLLIDSLEPRCMMAALPFINEAVTLRNTPHLVSLRLEQDTNEDAVINLAEQATNYSFLGSLQVENSTFHTNDLNGVGVKVGLKSSSYTTNPLQDVSLNLAKTIASFTINATANELSLQEAEKTFTLFGTRVGSTLSPFDLVPFALKQDIVRPSSVFDAIRTPLNTSLPSATITFSEAIVASSFGVEDISLSRNGNNVPLSGLEVRPTGGNRFIVANLGAFTQDEGNYVLQVDNAGVTDLARNPGNTVTQVRWTVDLAPPSFNDPPRLVPELDTGRSNQDGITNIRTGLAFNAIVDDSTDVSFEIRVRGGSQVIARSTGIATLTPNQFRGAFPDTITDGLYDVVAIAVDSAGNQATSSPLALRIDTSRPGKPRLTRDNTNSKVFGNLGNTLVVDIDVSDSEVGASIQLSRDALGVVATRTPLTSTETIIAISNSPTNLNSLGQTLQYVATQTDLAGNISVLSDPFFAVVDSRVPTLGNIALSASNPNQTTGVLPVAITDSVTPVFTVSATDERYARNSNTVVVELFRAENLTESIGRSVVNIGSSGLSNGGNHISHTFSTTLSLSAGFSLTPGQQNSLVFKITDSANQSSTKNFDLFVLRTTPPTIAAPSTPVDTSIYFLGARLLSPGTVGAKEISVDRAIRKGAVIRILDETKGTEPNSSNSQDVIVDNIRGSGPYTLTLRDELTIAFPASDLTKAKSTTISWLRPWTMSFDKTTQTTWFTNEDGHYLGQFDPATGQVKLYDVVLPGTSEAKSSYDPHGVFFDFNTHLTPRIWFVYRNENEALSDEPRVENGFVGRGRVGYFDIVQEKFFSFDLGSILLPHDEDTEPHPIEGTHAVFIDTRGHAWVSSEHSNAVVEIDLRLARDGTTRLGSPLTTGSVIIHKFPEQLADIYPKAPAVIPKQDFSFEVHGILVVVDQRKNEPYVWLSDGNENSTGRIVLLRPGSHDKTSLSNARPRDEWFEWSVDKALEKEKRLTQDPTTGKFTAKGHPLFLALDDNETPGIPEDDRILSPDAGALARKSGNILNNSSAGVVRSLDANNLIQKLVTLNPKTPFSKANVTIPSTSPIVTAIIPKIPGAKADVDNAAPHQVSADRMGTLYFADALGSVGRLSFDDVNLVRTSIDAPIRYFETDFQVETATFTASPNKTLPISFTTWRRVIGSLNSVDRSQATGVDQYEAAQPSHRGRGEGGFRMVVSAENTLHTSLSQSDHISISVFAESNRRNIAVVQSIAPLPTGARVRGRATFQVLRDGSIVLTARGDGQLLDEQINLTKALLNGGKISSFDTAAVVGDVAALNGNEGRIELLGRHASGGLIRYTFKPPTTAWKTAELKNPAYWSASTRIVIPGGQVLAEDPAPNPDIGFTVTTATGHLIVIPKGTINVIDLSTSATSPAVFAGVSGLLANNRYRFYGSTQTGSLVEYSTNLSFGDIQSKRIDLSNRDLRILRNIRAFKDDTSIRLFGTDGVGQLVHYELDFNGNVIQAENVTKVIQNNKQFFGYFDFQKPYAGRVYTYVSVIKDANKNLRVYGTNGGDLIEFTRNTSGAWRVGNLTNNLHSTNPIPSNSPRLPANSVFGTPSAYVDTLGERHILQINVDGEIVDYYTLVGDTTQQLRTQNINLRIGETSTIPKLRYRVTAPIISQSLTQATVSSRVGLSTREGEASEEIAQSVPPVGLHPFDVNSDGVVSPLDVLNVINRLNSRTVLPVASDQSSVYGDVSGDGQVSPIDVLMIVNYLARGGQKAEGEPSGLANAAKKLTTSPSRPIANAELAFSQSDDWYTGPT